MSIIHSLCPGYGLEKRLTFGYELLVQKIELVPQYV